MSVVSLVTGAGSGIGRAAAVALARERVEIVACDIDARAAAETAASIVSNGQRARALTLDVRDDLAVVEALRALASEAPLASVVHSAALFPQQSFAQTSLDELDNVLAVNFRAAFVLAKSAAALMPSGGSLVFLTSGAGLIESARDPFQREFSVYGASKAALDRWAIGVTDELLTQGIVVTLITPGAFVRTSGTRSIKLSHAAGLVEIQSAAVGEAIAWLAHEPRAALAGARLSAAEFRRTWGPIV
jgi:3-oxoacyl-[acyl-carrier protein] reductase